LGGSDNVTHVGTQNSARAPVNFLYSSEKPVLKNVNALKSREP